MYKIEIINIYCRFVLVLVKLILLNLFSLEFVDMVLVLVFCCSLEVKEKLVKINIGFLLG